MFTFSGLDHSFFYISHQQARGRSADTLSPASCSLSLDAAHARHVVIDLKLLAIQVQAAILVQNTISL